MNLGGRVNKYLNGSSSAAGTRGCGLLERFLAIERARIAKKFISGKYESGSILDVGCGRYPIFLLTSKFVEKFGIDKQDSLDPYVARRFKFISYGIEEGERLPFDNNTMDVVTMLAVMEHIGSPDLGPVMSEIYRILKPGGICIGTIPSPWAESLLTLMASMGLISKIEITDHKSRLSNSDILKILNKSGFGAVGFGYFEFFMNRWFVAKKRRMKNADIG